ncbi:MAG TPA: PAS domain S-box protein, partial [Bacteroidia bacterium]|nr:PAS domain S-box protein [Bacteroidia bacterium]
MKKLTEYLAFIKENHLEEVARDNLRSARAMNLPLLKLIEGMSEEMLLEQGKKSIRDFADQLADGTYVEKRNESLKKWENDELPELRNHSIQAEDLILIYPLQRKMFYNFLSRYTSDAQLVLDILEELDELQTASQINALNVLMKKQRRTEEQVQFQSYLLNNATDAILTMDISRHITYANKASEKMFGFAKEEFIGKLSTEAFRSDPKSEKLRHDTNKILVEKGNASAEIVYLNKAGNPVPLLLSASEMVDKNGERIGYIYIFKDIRERIKHEQEIEQANTFLNTVLENIPNMIFVKDAKELRFVRFNKAGEELLGYSRTDLIGKNDYDFFPKEQADLFTAKDRDVLDKKVLLDIREEPVNSLSKGERWLHTKKLPVLGEDGKPAFLMGISEDITEYKKAEDELKKTKDTFLKIFSTSPVSTYITDVETGRFILVNDAFEKTFLMKREDVIGKTVVELKMTSAEEREKAAKKIKEQKGGVKGMELELRIGDGTMREMYVSSDIIEMDGRPCFIATMFDITERKKTEEKISRLNKELNDSILQLNYVNKELEAFTYSVSHDLRAPLRAVNGYANMLEEESSGKMDEEAKRLLGVIRYNAEKMGRLIDDLLAFSRLGRKEIEKNEEDMNQLVNAVIVELNKSIPNHAEIKIGKLHKA